MKFSEIRKEWEQDEEIDPTNIGNEALKTVKLTTKYLNILAREKYEFEKMRMAHKKLERDFEDYFLGNETLETRERIGKTEPFSKRIHKAAVGKYVETDDQIIKSYLRLAGQEEKIQYLKEIIKSLRERNWAIKHFIDDQKFKRGM